MKIRNIAFIFLASACVFLASCGDADGDGLAPMDEKGNVISDVTRDVTESLTDDERRVRENETENHITKDAPDYANTNF